MMIMKKNRSAHLFITSTIRLDDKYTFHLDFCGLISTSFRKTIHGFLCNGPCLCQLLYIYKKLKCLLYTSQIKPQVCELCKSKLMS